eukprot:TRINITY_DN34906_c0_g1_i1.p2 TRINITY_DN34906_c0_g1~~TRINITY_DN34906_c0_g1_i1.p2  ORF type:complete len:134 (-),score=25.14 TRINITY_DN34906_c0_g1_i1:120-521(-)
MIRRPPRSTHCISSAASDVYKRQTQSTWGIIKLKLILINQKPTMNTTSSKSEKYRLHYPYSVSSQRYLTNTFEQQKPTYTYYSNDISPPPLISHKTMGYPTTIETRPLTQITHSPIMSYTCLLYTSPSPRDQA